MTIGPLTDALFILAGALVGLWLKRLDYGSPRHERDGGPDWCIGPIPFAAAMMLWAVMR